MGTNEGKAIMHKVICNVSRNILQNETLLKKLSILTIVKNREKNSSMIK